MIRGLSYELSYKQARLWCGDVSLNAEMQHTNTIRLEYVQFL
jgi:hypothetical protein